MQEIVFVKQAYIGYRRATGHHASTGYRFNLRRLFRLWILASHGVMSENTPLEPHRAKSVREYGARHREFAPSGGLLRSVGIEQ